MNLFLLITILVVSLVTMVCSLITTILVVNKYKGKELVKKTLGICGIVLLVISIAGLAFWASSIESSSTNTSKTTTEEEQTEDELSEAGFNKVSIDEYLQLINSSEKSIVLVARPTCYYCQKFTPVLKQAMEDMSLTINYVNTDEFSEDDWTKFNDSLDYLKNNEWGTPLTLIVQNGKSVAENSGYTELDTIKDFFKNNGFGN